MGKIFVSYRQKGTFMRAGRIADALVNQFGEQNIFQDKASLFGGANWKEQIEDAIKECTVFVAVIGPEWTEHKNADGSRRLDDLDDYVRFEVATALQREIGIIPVLVDGAGRLREEQLPEPMKKLAYIEPMRIDDNAWHEGISTLLKAIKKFDLDPKRIGWKNISSLTSSTIGLFALSPDVVPQAAAVVGIICGLVALFLSIRSYVENKEGAPSARNWAIGAIIFAAMVFLVGIDELIPDEYF